VKTCTQHSASCRHRLFAAGALLCPGLVKAAGDPDALMEPLSLTHVLQVSGALILVLLIFAGLVLLMKRFSGLGGVSGEHLRIVEVLSLGTRDRLLLVQLGETQLLLGQSPGRIQTLHVLDQALPVNRGRAGGSLFAARLRRAAEGSTRAEGVE